jgi:hypothetical protein
LRGSCLGLFWRGSASVGLLLGFGFEVERR